VDFFISYAKRDRAWAEWVTWQLEHAKGTPYTVEFDAWDWSAGRDWVQALVEALGRADRVLALYSPAYLEHSAGGPVGWSDALLRDKDGRDRLLPVRIAPVDLPEVVRTRIHVDLFGLDAAEARSRLLDAAGGPRRPDGEPAFPPSGVAGQEPTRAEPRIPGARPTIWNLPDRNRDFVGRDDVLWELRESLAKAGPSAVQTISGMGGVGKTQVAIEYAYRHAGDYDVAWWADAEQAELVAEKLDGLHQALKPAGGTPPGAFGAGVPETVRWLLILDNAEDSASIVRWRPTSGHGHVLVTSRNPHWYGVGARLEVDVLDPPEAAALVRAGVADLDEPDAGLLADALGYLPLALAQAAAFLRISGTTTDEYLRLLKSHTGKIMSQGTPREYPRSLAASWEISVERLAGEDRAAVELLQLAAFFAPEPISFDLLRSGRAVLPARLAGLVADEYEFAMTRARIGRYSLARIEQGTIQLHRLIQALTRDRLSAEDAGRARRIVRAVLVQAEPGDPRDPATWEGYRRMLPHLLAADLGASEDRTCRQLLLDTVTYLSERGETAVAHRLVGGALESWERTTDRDDSHRLSAMTALARTLTDLGRYAEALPLDEEVLLRSRSTLGNDHPATLAAANDVAADLSRLGRYDDARRIDQETFEARRVTLGPDHLDTLASANNLAVNLWHLGRHEEARDLDQATLARRRERLGHDHPDTLTSASNLAADLRGLGQFEEARGLDEDVRTRRVATLGADHPDTIRSGGELAADLGGLGHHDDARDLYEETVARSRRVLGGTHPDTLGAVENLANELNQLGEHERARTLDEETLIGRRGGLGANHPVTLRAADNVAGDLRRAGLYEAARDLDEDTLQRRREVLGDDHPDTVRSRGNVLADKSLLKQSATSRPDGGRS
jgi:tetratricopeptide (TPR) repeat protein